MKVEKGIPHPGPQTKYPLGTMEVGDSFAISLQERNKVSGTFHAHRPKKFSRRTVLEDGKPVVRVWRIA